jgi:amino acid adenylation domain-containing protein
MISGGAVNVAAYLEDSAARHPDRVALVGPGGQVLTYRELDAQAERVAAFLLEAGIVAGDRVAIAVTKSNSAVVALWACLKIRAPYVPIDWRTPVARQASILQSSGARALFADPSVITSLRAAGGPMPPVLVAIGGREGDGAGATWWDDVLTTPARAYDRAGRCASDVAYILHTSGSTGVPKGVTLTHENAVSFIDWCSELLSPTPADRFGSHAPLQFDLSVLDLFVPIKHGGSVHLIGEDVAHNPKGLVQFISERELTVWYSTPTTLSLITEFGRLEDARSNLRVVLFAGEVFPVKILRRLVQTLRGVEFYNLYGPTETNVCTFIRIPEEIDPTRTEPFPIGKVCSHCTALVLDEARREAPPGAEGLLYIAGPSVFREYWNDPAKTAASILEYKGRRWYNTGDVVRPDPRDGFIYLGRRDRMVKRRGYRIELGEIESALYQHERVRGAAAVPILHPDGTQIWAFLVTPPNAKPTLIELKQFCAERLPIYMNPDGFIFLDALPRTSTDKVDYQELTRRLEQRATM